MTRSAEVFARAIQPVDLNTFFGDYWERQSLVIWRNEPGYFADLMSTTAIDHILSSTDLRLPAFRLVREGTQIPVSEYTRDIRVTTGTFAGLADLNHIYAEYQKGATIVLQALERSWPPLIEFCKALEHFFGHPIQANLYFTPANAQGFAAHYDTHDTLILQVEGKKRWKVYDAPFPLPLAKQKYSRDEIKYGEPQFDLTLNAGDTLYMPRGVIHEALTSDSYSLHITIGIKVWTWLDAVSRMVAQALTECEQEIAFRRSLPLRFASDEGQIVEKTNSGIADLIDAFKQHLDPNRAHDLLADQFVLTRLPSRKDQLLDLQQVEVVTLDSQIARRDHMIFRLKLEGDAISLSFQGKRIHFPADISETVEFVTQSERFRVRELAGNLDDAGKLVLVKRLIREGFLTLDHDEG